MYCENNLHTTGAIATGDGDMRLGTTPVPHIFLSDCGTDFIPSDEKLSR